MLFGFVFGKLVALQTRNRLVVVGNRVFLHLRLCVERGGLFFKLRRSPAHFFDLHMEVLRVFGCAVNLRADFFERVRGFFMLCLRGGDFVLLLAQTVVGFVNGIKPSADFEPLFLFGQN